jgi:hypothetical protein
MARIEYDPPEVGAPRAAAAFNAILTAVATETTNVNELNLARDGLDLDAFADGAAVSQAFDPVQVDGPDALVMGAATPWATLNVGTNMQSAAFDLLDDEMLLVESSVGFTTEAGAVGLPVTIDPELRLVYRVGGVTTQFDAARKQLDPNSAGHGDLSLAGVLMGPATITWVALQIQNTGAGAVRFAGRTLVGTIYKRIS